jgi:hypothetical protein
MPRLGSQETSLDVWRIGGKYRDEEDEEEEDDEEDEDEVPKEPIRATYHHDYVWRFSTHVRDGIGVRRVGRFCSGDSVDVVGTGRDGLGGGILGCPQSCLFESAVGKRWSYPLKDQPIGFDIRRFCLRIVNVKKQALWRTGKVKL